MDTRKTIIATFAVPAVLILGFALFRSYYDPNQYGPYKHYEITEPYYMDDATVVPVSLSVPENKKANSLWVLVPDMNLDHNWSSSGGDFRTGKYLAKVLSTNGSAVIRYDQRGTGKSIISGHNRHDIRRSAQDLKNVILKTSKQHELTHLPIRMIAQGNGCYVALKAAADYKLNIKQMILTGCMLDRTPLEIYTEQMLNRMESRGIPSEKIALYREEVARWMSQKTFSVIAPNETAWVDTKTEETKTNTNTNEKTDNSGQTKNDLLSLHQTLVLLQSPDMIAWTNSASSFNTELHLNNALKQQIEIFLYAGEYDTMFSSSMRERLKENSAKLPLNILAKTNHFLKEQKSPSRSAAESQFDAVNPALPLSHEFVKMLLKQIESPDHASL